MKKLFILISLVLIVSVDAWSSSSYTYKSSSIENCQKDKSWGETVIEKCSSTKSYNVFLEKLDVYSGVIIQHKRSKYNILELINEIPAGKCTIGAATQVSGRKLNWIYQKNRLVAFSVKVSGIDILSENQKRESGICVITIDERKHSKVLGLVETKSEVTELLNLHL